MGSDEKSLDGPVVDEKAGFYRRWSERKLASQQPLVTEDSIIEEPQLTDEDMPPLESLTETSDFSGFLSPKVSEQLRQLALRKLFHSTAFNVCDGLDDYAEDFTQFEALGDLITADLRHRMALEERQKEVHEVDESEDQNLQPQHADSDVAEAGREEELVNQVADSVTDDDEDNQS